MQSHVSLHGRHVRKILAQSHSSAPHEESKARTCLAVKTQSIRRTHLITAASQKGAVSLTAFVMSSSYHHAKRQHIWKQNPPLTPPTLHHPQKTSPSPTKLEPRNIHHLPSTTQPPHSPKPPIHHVRPLPPSNQHPRQNGETRYR